MNSLFERLIDMSSVSLGHELSPQSLRGAVEGSGFDGLTLLRIQGTATSFFASHAEEWQRIYLERTYFRIDPVVEITKRKRSLTAWTLRPMAVGRSADIKEMCSLAEAHGIRSGLALPISIGFGHLAVFTLYSSSSSEPDVSKIDPVLAAAAVTHLHTNLELAASLKLSPFLRPKEIQCLKWASEGKSIREVADLEGVSYSTARFFIDRAKAALGAVSLPQATALAKEFQLI